MLKLIFIFKIIGIILLAVLGVVLVILLYVLLAPIGYRGRIFGRGKAGARLDVHDLLRLARFSIIYEAGEHRAELILLWGLISRGRSSQKDEASEEASPPQEPEDTSTDDELQAQELEDDAALTFSEEEAPQVREPKPTKPYKEELSEPREPDDSPLIEPDQNIRDPIPPEPVGSGAPVSKEPGKLGLAKDVLSDRHHKAAVLFILSGAIRLLYRARPHFKGADLTFSTGSPDTTGQLTGALSLCAGVYDENVRLIPDFVEKHAYFKGWADIYGSLSLIFAVIFLIRLIANRDCRRLYREIRRRS